MDKKHKLSSLKNQAQKKGKIGMYNHQQFKDVCISYFLILKFLVSLLSDDMINDPIFVHRINKLMQMIQKRLNELQKNEKRYRKHLFDCRYCEQMLKPHIQELTTLFYEVHLLIQK